MYVKAALQRSRAMQECRIISAGSLTLRDLEVLGRGFARHFPVPDDQMFADLIRRLDTIEASSCDQEVVAS
jgi:hypothetical protein